MSDLNELSKKIVSRRDAMKKAGSLAAAAGLAFVGLGLSGTNRQVFAGSGGGCTWCDGGCTVFCGLTCSNCFLGCGNGTCTDICQETCYQTGLSG